MNTLIKTDFKGMTQEAVNVELHNNVMKTVDPKRNAIIIDYIEVENEDNEMVVDTIITIECKDDKFYDRMKVKASSLARSMVF